MDKLFNILFVIFCLLIIYLCGWFGYAMYEVLSTIERDGLKSILDGIWNGTNP